MTKITKKTTMKRTKMQMEPHQIEAAICLCDINHNQNKVLRVSLSRCNEVYDTKILEDTHKFGNDALEKSGTNSVHSFNQSVASNKKLENPSTPKIEQSSLPRRSQRIKLIPNKTSQESTKPAEQQKMKQLRSNNAVISTTQMTSILWRELTLKGFEIKIGMIVCAKMATFWPWPAQVINFQRNRARVKFFGDLREGSVIQSQCVPFINCHHIIFNYLSSIDKLTIANFKRNVIDNLSEPRNIRHKPLKEQYLQSIKDVEVYLESQNSLLASI